MKTNRISGQKESVVRDTEMLEILKKNTDEKALLQPNCSNISVESHDNGSHR